MALDALRVNKLRSSLTMASVATLLALSLASNSACSSSTAKTCTTDEVKKCDDNLNVCIAKSPCDDATNPAFQSCVDACKKQNCDCQTACGNTCTRS